MRGCPLSLLSRAQQVRGSRRRRMNESESLAPRRPGARPPAPGRAERWWTELQGPREPAGRLIPRRGAGSGTRSHRRAAAPAPPPLLPASHAPLRRYASLRPRPRRLLALPAPPASSSRSAGSADPEPPLPPPSPDARRAEGAPSQVSAAA